MEEAILRLTRYWTENGCVLAQPINTEVGAGTLNPATFLRVLGPEPWSTVYVEPSVRPDDSRYGDNPNRMQTHTQLQVVLKPDPRNSQDLYLASLEGIGIDPRVHDVRFVEDNWESPALGAWGLGWEVWLDGLEITQFTYFQQAGGLAVDPVSVEITYGLERILMALQGVTHFKDIAYADGVSYGEIVGQAEREMSVYYLEAADVATMRQLLELYESEAARLIALRLPLPAHYYVLKCSHTFNVLDSRGAIGTTERARSFRRMRGLAHDVARLWVERRMELGYPLGMAERSMPAAPTADIGYPTENSTFVLELGFEELPADEVTSLAAQLKKLLADSLAQHRLEFASVKTFATPRRIIATVETLQPRQADRVVRSKGPRAEAAFDADGVPTRAAEGFARKHGVGARDLVVESEGATAYVFVSTEERGRPAGDVLAAALPTVIASITPKRAMRWSAGPDVSSSRPLRWIVALLGGAVVPFSWGDVSSGRTTHALRNARLGPIRIERAADALETLHVNGIEYDGSIRRLRILTDSESAAQAVSGAIDARTDVAVLTEVTNMVEHPQVILGAFDEQYLRLPSEVLTVVMKKHQRYLPVRDGFGELLPYFVSVANGPIDPDAVRAGNEAVLRARYADAAFFFDRDRERPLESFRPELSKLVFEEKAGTMLDRADRILTLSNQVSSELMLDADAQAVTARASYLSKADLATSLVVELPVLAGLMGKIYASEGGERPDVAEAIFEATLPRFADDALPDSLPGAVISVADRADALASLFAAGAKPTGSNDPYALRRAATGLVQILVRHSLPLRLSWLFRTSAEQIELGLSDDLLAEVKDFVETRFEVRLTEDGHRPELVRAVRKHFDEPALTVSVLKELEGLQQSPDFYEVAAAYRRVQRLAAKTPIGEVDISLQDETAESALWQAFTAIEPALRAGGLSEYVSRFSGLVSKIDSFFDKVLVMADDIQVRRNRLSMLARIADCGARLLDWEELPDAPAPVSGDLG